MSARFWLFNMASAGAALVSGLGLGLYATTPPRMAMSEVETPLSTTQQSETQPDWTGLHGPAEIRCTGCGPTLAERQMTAMMGGWDGYSDPVVRDYEAQDHAAPNQDGQDEMTPFDASPSPVHQLSANVDRFAAVGSAPAQTVQLAQGWTSLTDGDQAEQSYP